MNSIQNASPTLQAVKVIEQRLGIAQAAQYRADVDNVLWGLSRGDIEKFVHKLQNSRESAMEWQTVIESISVGETYFLRDKPHFQMLRSQTLPDLIMKCRQQNRLSLNIWSVGCATGEEPYSLAITLYELLPDLPRWTINIIGTDINGKALQAAREGVYRQWAFRHTDESFQQTYFDATTSGWKIKKFIANMVNFRLLNVLDSPPMTQFDIIFSRNVLLYFGRNSIRHVENTFFQSLIPGGWLVLGQAETIRFERERWIMHIFPGTAIYQKPAKSLPLKAGAVNYQQNPVVDSENGTSNPKLPVIQSTYEDAVRAAQSESYDEAERFLATVLLHHPKDARAHTLLAFIFANRKALPEAQAHLDTALRSEPLLADAHYVRAMIHLEEANTEAGMKALQSALYSQRDHALAAFTLGNLYAQSGDLSKAYRQWQSARKSVIKSGPDDLVSDLSDMTVARFRLMLNEHLDE